MHTRSLYKTISPGWDACLTPCPHSEPVLCSLALSWQPAPPPHQGQREKMGASCSPPSQGEVWLPGAATVGTLAGGVKSPAKEWPAKHEMVLLCFCHTQPRTHPLSTPNTTQLPNTHTTTTSPSTIQHLNTHTTSQQIQQALHCTTPPTQHTQSTTVTIQYIHTQNLNTLNHTPTLHNTPTHRPWQNCPVL